MKRRRVKGEGMHTVLNGKISRKRRPDNDDDDDSDDNNNSDNAHTNYLLDRK